MTSNSTNRWRSASTSDGSEADRSRRSNCRSARKQDPALAARLAALPSNDAELAAAIRAGPVAGTAGTPSRPARSCALRPSRPTIRPGTRCSWRVAQGGAIRGVFPSIDELDRAAIGHGLMTVSDPAKGVIRRIPLVSGINGTLAPTLSIRCCASPACAVAQAADGRRGSSAYRLGTSLRRPKTTVP